MADEDSRIMTVAGGGFQESYNAQAVVTTGSLLVVANDVAQAPNAKEQLVPMINKIRALPTELVVPNGCSPAVAISAKPMWTVAPQHASSR